MRVRGRALASGGLAVVVLGCASAPPPSISSAARVSVEVLRGFSPAEVAPIEAKAPIVVIFDSTRSMSAPTSIGAPLELAAKRAAQRFVSGVRGSRPVWLYTIGSGEGAECLPLFRGARAETPADRAALAREVDGMTARGEGALAGALEGVHRELQKAGVLAGSRIVVFSDLGPDCGGDACAAATALLNAGARLDLVAIGDVKVPACLLEPGGLVERVPAQRAAERPLHFRVEVSDPEPMVVGCSEVDGLPVAAPAGRGTLVVDLDPPLRVDAYFAPGKRQVLQILDFPTLDPPRRHWRWLDAAASEANP